MLPMLRPAQGAGLPNLSYPVKSSGSIGEIRYSASSPSLSYLPADGSSIKAADYPEYSQIYNQGLGYYTRKLTDPDLTGLSTNTTAFASAISPDGLYAFMTRSTIQPLGNVYKIGDSSITYLQSVSAVDGSSILGGPESAAFAPNADYLAFGSTTTPYLTIRRRSSDDFTTAVTISGSAPNAVPTAISITEDNVAMVSHNTAGNNYVGLFQLSGTTATRLPGAFPGSLPGVIQQITRNKSGSRYAFRFTGAPYVKIYDYAGGGVFSEVVGALPTINSSPTSISMSINGEYLALAMQDTNAFVEVYKASSASTYVSHKILSRLIGSTVNFSPDDRQLLTGLTASPLATIYQPASGAFLELTRGNIGAYGNILQRKISRNGKAMLGVQTVSPYITVYAQASSMVDVCLPAYPTKYGVSAPLYPFIKVK